MITIKKFKEIAEENGFNIKIYKEDNGRKIAELQQYTPAGEDWYTDIECGKGENIIDNLADYIHDFDVDEETEKWIDKRGEGGCPSSIKELVADQEWKLETLQNLLVCVLMKS